MGHSSLLGTESPATEPAGRDTATLGPSDSSDSGSDLAGLEERSGSDPAAPVDVALRADSEHPLLSPDALDARGSDGAGTGERRGVDDGGAAREAADIGVDRIVTPHSEVGDDAAGEADVVTEGGALDELVDAASGDPLDEEPDDEQ